MIFFCPFAPALHPPQESRSIFCAPEAAPGHGEPGSDRIPKKRPHRHSLLTVTAPRPASKWQSCSLGDNVNPQQAEPEPPGLTPPGTPAPRAQRSPRLRLPTGKGLAESGTPGLMTLSLPAAPSPEQPPSLSAALCRDGRGAPHGPANPSSPPRARLKGSQLGWGPSCCPGWAWQAAAGPAWT